MGLFSAIFPQFIRIMAKNKHSFSIDVFPYALNLNTHLNYRSLGRETGIGDICYHNWQHQRAGSCCKETPDRWGGAKCNSWTSSAVPLCILWSTVCKKMGCWGPHEVLHREALGMRNVFCPIQRNIYKCLHNHIFRFNNKTNDIILK